jgi:hypothetical protein
LARFELSHRPAVNCGNRSGRRLIYFTSMKISDVPNKPRHRSSRSTTSGSTSSSPTPNASAPRRAEAVLGCLFGWYARAGCRTAVAWSRYGHKGWDIAPCLLLVPRWRLWVGSHLLDLRLWLAAALTGPVLAPAMQTTMESGMLPRPLAAISAARLRLCCRRHAPRVRPADGALLTPGSAPLLQMRLPDVQRNLLAASCVKHQQDRQADGCCKRNPTQEH